MSAVKSTLVRFGTDGIRGRAGELLTPNLAMELGYWAGRELAPSQSPGQPFILGQDSRTSSDMLAMGLAAGLTAAGLTVWQVGLCPTPCVAYLVHHSEAVGGAMISASHNPPEDNGIKIFDAQGNKLSQGLQKAIETHLNQGGAWETSHHWGHNLNRPELLHTYGQALTNSLGTDQPLAGMTVVLDLAYGAAVSLAPQIFQQLGATVICLHNQANGEKINVNCGSTHLDPLRQAVQEFEADLGFAFDGDADRVLAVDGLGRTIDGDHILYFWGQTLQQAQQLPGDLIVATVMSNLGFERAWEQRGGTLVRAAVGDQYVHAEMLRYGAMLGGEQSGHILCRHYGIGGDGLLTAIHLAALVKRAGCSLRHLKDSSFASYPQILRNVKIMDRERRLAWQDCQPLQTLIAQATADMGDQGRILVRASGTEPVIRVMVEAVSATLAEHWTSKLVTSVETYLAA